MVYQTLIRTEKPNYLFENKPLRGELQSYHANIQYTINNWKDLSAINRDIEDSITKFMEEVQIDIPHIDEDSITVENEDVKLDVSGEAGRDTERHRGPLFFSGTKYIFHIPFQGNPQILNWNDQTMMFNHGPIGEIKNNEIIVSLFTASDTDNPEEVRRNFDTNLQKIKNHLQSITSETEAFKLRLPGEIRPLIEQRIKKLENDSNSLSKIGFPLKKQQLTPEIFTIPIEKKTIVQKESTPKSIQDNNPKVQDYVISEDSYEEILDLLQSMSLAIERSPEVFAKMEEEHIRFVLLVPLNAQFKGTARGEVFNLQGKTDILITHEGKNLFIAECKFWKGEEVLRETIDQILGYTSWRDSKTAILIFNKNKNLTNVLEQIPSIVEKHPAFVERVPYDNQTGFRFKMKNKNDENRHFVMTVLVFDIPSAE